MHSTTHAVVSIIGTRPELQRVIPVLHELKKRVSQPIIIYIPQKQDADAQDMLEKSGIPYTTFPTLFAKRKAGSIDTLIQTIQKKLITVEAQTVLISGDTTVAVAGCLAARQNNVPIAKIGGGFRLGDFNAPEEKNDILTDHLANSLFCFSEHSKNNLIAEGISEKKITLSGSTLIWHVHETLRSQFFRRDEKGSVLVSIHRKDHLENKSIMDTLFHTLTQKKIMATCITHHELLTVKSPRSKFITMHTTPVSYPAFIKKLAEARYVITDSNTLAEEACFLGVPCITIGSHSNRPETIAVGANILVNPTTNKKTFREELEKAIYKTNKGKKNWKFPYGDIKMTMFIANCIADTIKAKN
jgi:UDP-N-acetylglucosamine 2-epimerase (non-hydrolysing)